MNREALAKAYTAFRQQSDTAFRAFAGAIPPNTLHYDTAALNAAVTAYLANQAKIAALLLLPVWRPELHDKVGDLQRMYAKVIGTPKTPWVGTPTRSQQYEAAIDATVRLTLKGEPFRNYEIAHESGVSKNRLRIIFEGGDDELRNLAFERIVATVLAFVGVPDTPA